MTMTTVEATRTITGGVDTHLDVIEVDGPNRAERRRSGKSDPLDATEAARAALNGRAKSIPKA
jgi:hypothetical protein